MAEHIRTVSPLIARLPCVCIVLVHLALLLTCCQASVPAMISGKSSREILRCALYRWPELWARCTTEQETQDGYLRQTLLSLLNKCVVPLNLTSSQGLRMLMVQTASSNFYQGLVEKFSSGTGIAATLATLPFQAMEPVLQKSLLQPAVKNTTHDLWQITPGRFGDADAVGALMDLAPLVVNDRLLQWNDLPPVLRDKAMVYNNKLVGLPAAAVAHMLMYRQDLFDHYQLGEPPATWQQMVQLAAAFNGSADPAGLAPGGVYGLCVNWSCYASFWMSLIWTDIMQAQGPQSGTYYNPITMQPLVNNKAMERAMQLALQIKAVNAPDGGILGGSCATHNTKFARGGCLMTLNTPVEFKVISHVSSVYPLRGRLGFVPLPGSAQILDRVTDELVDCTPQICPYAELAPVAKNGTRLLVNRPPHLITLVMSINAKAAPEAQFYAYQLLSSLVSSASTSKMVVQPNLDVTPFRSQDFNLSAWIASGYDANDSRRFLTAYSPMLYSKSALANFDIALTMPGAVRYRNVLRAMYNNMTAGQDISSVMATAEAELQAAVLAAPGGLLAHRSVYWAAIQYSQERTIAVEEALPKGTHSHALVAGLSAGLPIAALLVAAFAALRALKAKAGPCRVWLLHRGAATAAPGVSPATTLVVTDLQDSTTLWENVSADVMAASMRLHDRLIRQAIREHRGYEACTEGDSFIIAFHDAPAALRFALAVQSDMLKAPWDAELLSHPSAAELHVVRQPLRALPQSNAQTTLSSKQMNWLSSASSINAKPSGQRGLVPGAASLSHSVDGLTPLDAMVCDTVLLPGLGSMPASRAPQHGLAACHCMVSTEQLQNLLLHSSSASMAQPVSGEDMQHQSMPHDRCHMGDLPQPSPAFAAGGIRSSPKSPRSPSSPRSHRDNGQGAAPVPCSAKATRTWSECPIRLSTLSNGGTPLGSRSLAHGDVPARSRSQPLSAGSSGRHACVSCFRSLARRGGLSSTGCWGTDDEARAAGAASSQLLVPAPSAQSSCAASSDWQPVAALAPLWHTLLEVWLAAWQPCPPSTAGAVRLFRGMRVRIGLHSGLTSAGEWHLAKASNRVTYAGPVLCLAKAVADATPGGQIMLSSTALSQLAAALAKWEDARVFSQGQHILLSLAAPQQLYCVLPADLVARIVLGAPPRTLCCLRPWALAAPLGTLAVCVLEMMGASALLATDVTYGHTYLEAFEAFAFEMLQQVDPSAFMLPPDASPAAPGRLVALFTCPAAALQWPLNCKQAMAERAWSNVPLGTGLQGEAPPDGALQHTCTSTLAGQTPSSCPNSPFQSLGPAQTGTFSIMVGRSLISHQMGLRTDEARNGPAQTLAPIPSLLRDAACAASLGAALAEVSSDSALPMAGPPACNSPLAGAAAPPARDVPSLSGNSWSMCGATFSGLASYPSFRVVGDMLLPSRHRAHSKAQLQGKMSDPGAFTALQTPDIRAGIDSGFFEAEVGPHTGHPVYRSRALKRVLLLVRAAQAGQVLCPAAVAQDAGAVFVPAAALGAGLQLSETLAASTSGRPTLGSAASAPNSPHTARGQAPSPGRMSLAAPQAAQGADGTPPPPHALSLGQQANSLSGAAGPDAVPGSGSWTAMPKAASVGAGLSGVECSSPGGAWLENSQRRALSYAAKPAGHGGPATSSGSTGVSMSEVPTTPCTRLHSAELSVEGLLQAVSRTSRTGLPQRSPPPGTLGQQRLRPLARICSTEVSPVVTATSPPPGAEEVAQSSSFSQYGNAPVVYYTPLHCARSATSAGGSLGGVAAEVKLVERLDLVACSLAARQQSYLLAG